MKDLFTQLLLKSCPEHEIKDKTSQIFEQDIEIYACDMVYQMEAITNLMWIYFYDYNYYITFGNVEKYDKRDHCTLIYIYKQIISEDYNMRATEHCVMVSESTAAKIIEYMEKKNRDF